VDGLPDDPEVRQEWLAGWADEQQRRLDAQPLSRAQLLRIQATVAYRRIGLQLSWHADRFLDRHLATRGIVTESEHTEPDRVAYVPSSWHVLPRALRYLRAGEQDTFIDFGCGKGRVVHQAARRPLRRVIGVEISPALSAMARATVAAGRDRHRCRDVRIVTCDATRYDIPDDLTIAYLFDPFRGAILDAVLENIVASMDRRPRTVRIIYVHPSNAGRVLATGRFRLVKEQRGGLRDRRTSRAAIFQSVPAARPTFPTVADAG
jgi:SAM-dependent methyltransferase